MVTAVASLFATGCTEQIEPDPVPALNSQEVYFSNDLVTEYVIGKNVLGEGANSYVEIPIYRLVDANDYTVSMRFAASEGFEATYDAPKFAAGQKESKLVISFDAGQLERGESADCIVKLDEEIASSYGKGYEELTFTITNPEPWVSLGYGTFYDDTFLPLIYSTTNFPTPVEFMAFEEDPNRIRVVNPYGAENFWEYLAGSVPAMIQLAEGTTYWEYDKTDPENIVFAENPMSAGFSLNFSDIGLTPIYLGIMMNEDGSLAEGAVTYDNGLMSFGKSMVVVLLDTGEPELQGWQYGNTSGIQCLIEPGVEVSDYAIEATYGGMFVGADNQTVNAIIDFAVGADVASYKFTIVPGNETANVDAIAATIIDGTCEQVIESDIKTLSYQISDLATGTYTVVAVAYNAENEAKNSVAYMFYFPGMGGSTEVPEVNANFVVDSVANLTGNPDYESQFPSTSSFGIWLNIEDPSQIVGMRIFIDYKDKVHAALDEGETIENIVDSAGEDVYEWILKIDEGNIRIYNQLNPGDYCLIFAIDTIYGSTQYYHVDYTVPAAEEAAPATASVEPMQVLKVENPRFHFNIAPLNR